MILVANGGHIWQGKIVPNRQQKCFVVMVKPADITIFLKSSALFLATLFPLKKNNELVKYWLGIT